MSIIFYLLPKTPYTVIACVVALFILLLLLFWNFWWIEDYIGRRVAVTVMLAVGCILIGYAAWPEPPKTTREDERKKDTPDLIASVDIMASGEAETYPGALSLTLIVSIRNMGAPSIVTHWELAIERPGHKPLEVKPTHPPETLTLHHNDGSSIKLKSGEAIYDKTVRHPIATGGNQQGFLFFIIRDIKREELFQKGVVLKLLYRDAWGRPFSLAFEPTGELKPIEHYPGMEGDVTLPKQRRK